MNDDITFANSFGNISDLIMDSDINLTGPDVENNTEVMSDLISDDVYDVTESEPNIYVDISTQEIIKMVNKVLNKNPNLVSRLTKNFNDVMNTLSENVNKFFNCDVCLESLYETNEEFNFFISIVGSGALAGSGYVDAIPCDYKIVFIDGNIKDNLSVRSSNIGFLYKNKPIIQYVSKVEFNSAFRKFYTQFQCNSDFNSPADYYLDVFCNKPIYDELDEIDVKFYTNLELANLISEGNKTILNACKVLPKSRRTSIILLLKAMKEEF